MQPIINHKAIVQGKLNPMLQSYEEALRLAKQNGDDPQTILQLLQTEQVTPRLGGNLLERIAKPINLSPEAWFERWRANPKHIPRAIHAVINGQTATNPTQAFMITPDLRGQAICPLCEIPNALAMFNGDPRTPTVIGAALLEIFNVGAYFQSDNPNNGMPLFEFKLGRTPQLEVQVTWIHAYRSYLNPEHTHQDRFTTMQFTELVQRFAIQTKAAESESVTGFIGETSHRLSWDG